MTAAALPAINAAVGIGGLGLGVFSAISGRREQRRQDAAASASRRETQIAQARTQNDLQVEEARIAGSRRPRRGRRLLVDERATLG